MQDIIKKTEVLLEALPYINAFRKKVFVIKYGGSILDDPEIRSNIFQDIIFLSYVGIRTILVHGGGPHISSRLKATGKEAVFHDGIRVTDKETLKIVSEELGKLNHQIVEEFKTLNGDVTGLKGHENIIYVEKKQAPKDLGFVGTITAVEKETIEEHLHKGLITVLSPMGVSTDQQPHNVNADEVASAIAISLKAEKLVFFTNVPGVLRNPAEPDSLISTLNARTIKNLIEEEVIAAGMIPKVKAGLEAVSLGVTKTHIIDAQVKHALLLEIFTDKGIGTQIVKEL